LLDIFSPPILVDGSIRLTNAGVIVLYPSFTIETAKYTMARGDLVNLGTVPAGERWLVSAFGGNIRLHWDADSIVEHTFVIRQPLLFLEGQTAYIKSYDSTTHDVAVYKIVL